jgi:hypothetical protein
MPITILPLVGQWEAFLIPLPAFPVPEEERAPVREFVRKVIAQLVKQQGCKLETFIQLTQLHLGDGASRLSNHGKEWMPSMGLGVWPDREPPHSWTMGELQDLVPGDKLRSMMDIALHVTRPEEGDNVRDVMLGLGTVLQFVLPAGTEEFLSAARHLLFSPIKDPSFTSFPFYIPLFEGKTISGASESQLELWLCGAHACIRESPEDQGILVFGKTALQDVLPLAGAVRSKEDSSWRIPS